jgi:hypothetical protein
MNEWALWEPAAHGVPLRHAPGGSTTGGGGDVQLAQLHVLGRADACLMVAGDGTPTVHMIGQEPDMPRKYAIPAAVMFIYASLLLAAGFFAFSNAPEGANPTTALVIPGAAALLMIIAGVLTLGAARNPRLGAIGAHVGVVLTILFTLLFGFTAWRRTGALDRYETAIAEYRQQVAVQAVPDTPEARKAFLEQRGAPQHDIRYLVRTLWFVTAISGASFIVLLVLRPKPGPEVPPTAGR